MLYDPSTSKEGSQSLRLKPGESGEHCAASVRVGDVAVPNVLGAGDGAAPRRAIADQLKFKSGEGRIHV
jgi:hypothetical protein